MADKVTNIPRYSIEDSVDEFNHLLQTGGDTRNLILNLFRAWDKEAYKQIYEAVNSSYLGYLKDTDEDKEVWVERSHPDDGLYVVGQF